VAPAAASTTGAVTFTTHFVQPDTLAGEPGVKLQPVGGSLVAFAPGDHTTVWRSSDGGHVWSGPTMTRGGSGDSDVAFSTDGVVYASDLLDAKGNSTIPLSVSSNSGRSFATPNLAVPTAAGVIWDRQWIAATGTDHVVVIAHNPGNGSIGSWLSDDRATSFVPGGVVGTSSLIDGPLTVGPDGSSLYTGYGTTAADGSLTLILAVSTDGGISWENRPIATFAPPAGAQMTTAFFPVVDFDQAGTLYGAFSVCATSGILPVDTACTAYVATSHDDGRHWSAPRTVSRAGHSAIFAWVTGNRGVACGATGKRCAGAAVVFYEARQPNGGPDLGPDLSTPLTVWDVALAETLDGGGTWRRATVASAFHRGSICVEGVVCAGPQQLTGIGDVPTPFDRRPLDFVEVAMDRSGSVVVVYPRDRSLGLGRDQDSTSSAFDLVAATQATGPRL
jgi:hypothetical protein